MTDETYKLKAVILKRERFRENDTRVVVYSLEKGKLELVARGAKKIKSKLAGHLEPMTLSNIMAIRGRLLDYAGSARGENFFAGIKTDLEKLSSAGKAFSAFLDIIKPAEPDESVFRLLESFLKTLDSGKACPLFADFFILKLLDHLGYKPELYQCVNCRKKITPKNNMFNPAKGGLICPSCSRPGSSGTPVSDDCIKILRLALDSSFDRLIKLKIGNILSVEAENIISSFVKYDH